MVYILFPELLFLHERRTICSGKAPTPNLWDVFGVTGRKLIRKSGENL
jgi:hypothetical protein